MAERDESPPTLPPRGSEAPTLAPDTHPFTGSPLAGGLLPRPFGRYRLDQLLGQGGMGAVYLAHDTQLNRRVALKIPALGGPGSELLRQRFFREAQAAAALNHPNICPIFDVGELDGTPFLTMAYIKGEPLAKRLESGQPMSLSAAAALVCPVADALYSAHSAGIIHRDLKPANIMIDERGAPIVMDFGLARRLDADFVGGQLTRPGDVLGTPAYMPPEQITGDNARIGPACDIYSLGMILYQLVTGDLPFQGDLLSLMSQVTLDSPEPPSSRRPGVDSRCDVVILRALEKEPARRYPSMRAFAEAIQSWSEAPPLMLRIETTSAAYRPRPGQRAITVGRQRRRPGDPDDVGNDVVVRVPGQDDLSTRISRRHFELQVIDGAWHVIDRSRVGTLHNDAALVPGAPTAVKTGDRLVLAGVASLTVLLESPAAHRILRPEVHLATATGQVVLEATLGDMITVD